MHLWELDLHWSQSVTMRLPKSNVYELSAQIQKMCMNFQHRYRRRHPNGHGEGIVPGLSLEQVDSMATQFPLCMSSLLQSLRKKHRLGHHARVCWICFSFCCSCRSIYVGIEEFGMWFILRRPCAVDETSISQRTNLSFCWQWEAECCMRSSFAAVIPVQLWKWLTV